MLAQRINQKVSVLGQQLQWYEQRIMRAQAYASMPECWLAVDPMKSLIPENADFPCLQAFVYEIGFQSYR